MEIKHILDLRKIKGISDYQFGQEVTDILFGNEENISIEYSRNTGKIKHVFYENNLMLNLRPTNGLFTISLFTANLINENLASPYLRAIVLDDISEFIKEGRNVFCKHVVEIDKNLRPQDEIIVTNQSAELLAIGKLVVPITYINSFKNGIAIKVRRGVNKSKL